MRQFKLVAAIAAVALVACGPQKVDPQLILSPSPRTIDGEGQTSTVRVQTTDEYGKPGSGTVHLVSNHGSLVDGTDVTLANGEGSTEFSCNRADDANCVGSVKLTATWNSLTINTNITVSGPHVPDAGITITGDRSVLNVGFNESSTLTVTTTLDGVAAPDREVALTTTDGTLMAVGGGAFQSPATTGANGTVQALLIDNGTPGAATVTATDVASGVQRQFTVLFSLPDAGVTIVANPSTIYAGVASSSQVLATLSSNGTPSANRTLEVTTTLGLLTYPDGGSLMNNAGLTDSNGVLELRLTPTSTAGTATLTAKDPLSGKQATTNVSIRDLQTIVFSDMTCGGTNCTVMGINGSGYNTISSLRFRVTDSAGAGVVSVPVTFDISTSSGGVASLTNTAGLTDASGYASVIVEAGFATGTFTVTATVGGKNVATNAIGVRGAKPSSKGFFFQCNSINLPVYVSATPPAQYQITCNVGLADRLGNPVGTGAVVSLKSEVGVVPATVATAGFTGVANAGNEGKASFTFETRDPFLSSQNDYAPLAADPTQYPVARAAEPFLTDGSLTHNPRDGLVTIIAFTDGEEWFKDDNGNAQYDVGEQFIDQGEPYVDTNDNNTYDGFDTFVDTNNDHVWNPPNGVWDGNTTVWKRFSVLYTDIAENFTATPATFDVVKGGTQSIVFTALDRNLNPPDQPTSVGFTFTSTKGNASFAGQARFDNYGFDWEENYLANEAGDGPCIDSTPICRYRAVFKTWASGYIGTATINGVPTTDTNPAVSAQAKVTVTTRTVPVPFTVNGTVE